LHLSVIGGNGPLLPLVLSSLLSPGGRRLTARLSSSSSSSSYSEPSAIERERILLLNAIGSGSSVPASSNSSSSESNAVVSCDTLRISASLCLIKIERIFLPSAISSGSSVPALSSSSSFQSNVGVNSDILRNAASLWLTVMHRSSTMPLKLLIDSTVLPIASAGCFFLGTHRSASCSQLRLLSLASSSSVEGSPHSTNNSPADDVTGEDSTVPRRDGEVSSSNDSRSLEAPLALIARYRLKRLVQPELLTPEVALCSDDGTSCFRKFRAPWPLLLMLSAVALAVVPRDPPTLTLPETGNVCTSGSGSLGR